jgi:hypothetical protein
MARRELSDLFFSDDTPEGVVCLEDLAEGNEFMLVPVRRRDRERWQKQHHMCPTCMGLGFLPGEKRALPCPKCGGRGGGSYADPEIRAAILGEVVRGWRGWTMTRGRGAELERVEIPFTQDNLRRVAEDVTLFAMLVSKAESLVTDVEASEGNV